MRFSQYFTPCDEKEIYQVLSCRAASGRSHDALVYLYPSATF